MKVRQLLSLRRLKVIFYLNLVIIVSLVGYRGYLAVFERDFAGVHAKNIDQVQQKLGGSRNFSFAVVGNINNSIGVFERTMIPLFNESGLDFLVSAGNAVSSGGEDKYRALHRTLQTLELPYFLTVGKNESSTFGSFHFYRHYGPYFYSFKAGNSQFIFMDSTDPEAYPFQLHWLEERLVDSEVQHDFIFLAHPVVQAQNESPIDFGGQYLTDEDFRDQLMAIFTRYGVSAVFSANLHTFDHQQVKGIDYVTTGGAGGLVLNTDTSFYHYVSVEVSGENFSIDVQELDIGQHGGLKRLESLWFWVHSLFYVGHLNFLLLLSALIVLAIKLYTSIFADRDYYPSFDLDPTPYQNRRLRVAMITNNYLPFIGGVPISIDRLRRGLEQLKHRVLIIAPSYRDQQPDEPNVVRVSSLLTLGKQREFRMANIFSLRIGKSLRAFKPDLIHIHHPFWLGWAALLWARRLKVPAVYTYHTRLEHYAHFVPLPGPLFRNFISHSLVHRFANRCEGVIVPTASAEEYLRIIGVRSHTYVQPTGIDFERFQTVSETAKESISQRFGITDERVFVSVSRLSKEKNIHFIIDSLSMVKQESSVPFKCLLIGDGNERQALQEHIEKAGMQDCIHLVGAVPPDEMVDYYQLGDLFVFASKSETQGMVILEAMAAHLPVVAVRSSGIDDVVHNEVNGYKTAEVQKQWAEKVRVLLEDDALRTEMADKALDFARGFAIDRFAGDVTEIYAHVLASYHDTRPSGAKAGR